VAVELELLVATELHQHLAVMVVMDQQQQFLVQAHITVEVVEAAQILVLQLVLVD
jgi:hypothetical protein